MSEQDTIMEHLKRQGISRRTFLKFCTLAASSMALPLSAVSQIAKAIETSLRPRVIWLSGQECTGCSESLLRSYSTPFSEKELDLTDLDTISLEDMIFRLVSLEYHNTLMAPSGEAAELSRKQAIYPDPDSAEAKVPLVVVIDGSIPLAQDGALSCVGGWSFIDVVKEAVAKAGLVVAVGNCASFGGLPKAKPNPTNAYGVCELMANPDLDLLGNKPDLPIYLQLDTNAPLVNIPGCPPVPEVITGVLLNFILYGAPGLDYLNRPLPYYGETVHHSCSRNSTHYRKGEFADSFDGEYAQQSRL